MKWFKKVMTYIALVIAAIALVLAILASCGIGIGISISSWALYGISALSVVVAGVINPEETKKIIGRVGDTIGAAFGAVTGAIGKGTSSLFVGLMPIILTLGAFIIGYKVLTGDDYNFKNSWKEVGDDNKQ